MGAFLKGLRATGSKSPLGILVVNQRRRVHDREALADGRHGVEPECCHLSLQLSLRDRSTPGPAGS